MKPAPFNYHTPGSLSDCLSALAAFGDDCVVLAGGQSLLPLLRFRMAQPENVISLREIRKELAYIRQTEQGIAIGAGITYAAAQRSQTIASALPGLLKTIELIATPAVRSRGTLCGNLVNADPASELPALALLLEANFKLLAASGERIVPAKDFFLGPYMTDRRSDELLAEIQFPVRPMGERVAIREVTRLRGGFPMAGIAVALVDGDAAATLSARVACFGVNPVQTRAPNAEAELIRLGFGSEGMSAAATALAAEIKPHADMFASEAYRRAAAQELLKRAISDALGRPCS
jgi:carbon-monoxide dehydrogenase medium subunit